MSTLRFVNLDMNTLLKRGIKYGDSYEFPLGSSCSIIREVDFNIVSSLSVPAYLLSYEVVDANTFNFTPSNSVFFDGVSQIDLSEGSELLSMEFCADVNRLSHSFRVKIGGADYPKIYPAGYPMGDGVLFMSCKFSADGTTVLEEYPIHVASNISIEAIKKSVKVMATGKALNSRGELVYTGLYHIPSQRGFAYPLEGGIISVATGKTSRGLTYRPVWLSDIMGIYSSFGF